jgi:hypothetical protein
VAFTADARFVLESLCLDDRGLLDTPPDHIQDMALPLLALPCPITWRNMNAKLRQSQARESLYIELYNQQPEAGNSRCPPLEWKNLKTIALTSYNLRENQTVATNDLLYGAAGAAMKMPSLQTMEIWNDDEDGFCVFRYSRFTKSESPTIYLASTWHHDLPSHIPERWKKVAEKHGTRNPLEVVVQVLYKHRYRKFGSGVRLLELRDHIMHPVSACELDWNSRQEF